MSLDQLDQFPIDIRLTPGRNAAGQDKPVTILGHRFDNLK